MARALYDGGAAGVGVWASSFIARLNQSAVTLHGPALASPALSPQYSTVTDIYASTLLALTQTIGRAGSISPTDAARAVAAALAPEGGPDAWHRYLPPIRRAADALARDGRIEILRKGKPVDPAGVKGVIRLRIAAAMEA
jgi:hypothetical protein